YCKIERLQADMKQYREWVEPQLERLGRVTADPPYNAEPPSAAPSDTARLNWWFMNVIHVGDDDDDDESGIEIDYESRLCRTPDEFRKLVDAMMGAASTASTCA